MWMMCILNRTFFYENFEFGIIFTTFAHYVCSIYAMVDCVCPNHMTIIAVFLRGAMCAKC